MSVLARTFAAPRSANTQLLSHIDAVLSQAGVGRHELAAVAVGVSVGSYTGVRIAVATAKGVAQGLNLPLYGLATDAEKLSPDHLLDCFDAAYTAQTGDPSSVLPHYPQLSYAEEAEKAEHPERYARAAETVAAEQAIQENLPTGPRRTSFDVNASRWKFDDALYPLPSTVAFEAAKCKDSSVCPYPSAHGSDREASAECAEHSYAGRLLLGIETSCDETAVAVMEDAKLLSNVVASQVKFHARFGGVVPEIASRKHSEAIVAAVDLAMEQAGLPLAALTGIAVADSPGLIGALVVGQAYAKGLGWALQVPVYGINHLEGHLYACCIDDNALVSTRTNSEKSDSAQTWLDDLPSPHLALLVSGGHTALIYSPAPHEYETLGETLDDAAGEAFDKVAKVLGLAYPGGPILSKLAEQGDPKAIDFPRAMIHSKDFAFSLSGLKTAVITYIRDKEIKGEELHIPNIAASFQAAVVDVQVSKAVRAARETGAKHFVMAGGVAANKVLREALIEALAKEGVATHIPPFKYCGDNAAMIVRTAFARLAAGKLEALELSADCSSSAMLDTSKEKRSIHGRTRQN